MFNLSDKDLDRLSREAAEEHDPGDIVGPRSWDKLEIRLDRQLGHVTPRPVRGFYRLPFYYAPVVLLILGASYYFIRNHKTQKEVSSGSPPLTSIKPSPAGTDKPSASYQNPTQTDKSTSTLVLPPATATQSAAGQPPAPAAGTAPGHDLTSGSPATSPASATPAAAHSGNTSSSEAGHPGVATTSAGLTSGNNTAATPGAGSLTTRNLTSATGTTRNRLTHHHTTSGHNRLIASSSGSSTKASDRSASPDRSVGPDETSTNRSTKGSGTTPPPGVAFIPIPAPPDHSAAAENFVGPASTRPSSSVPSGYIGRPLGRPLPGQLSLSSVRGPVPTKRPGSVSDSALRHFTAKAIPTPIRRKDGMSVNRSLQIGLLFAPDFSSVSSQSGDKPGSTIGLTADYQFAHRWYIGSGLLLSRKNYAAAPQNYHVPKDYYSRNNMNNVDFIKGSFNMLEVPLNLRYDFSVTGNTLFFATAGLSSYLLSSENCNYYYHSYFAQQLSKNMHYNNEPDYLFSALNLSVGVEMGINNSLSVLVAPYVKVPVRNIGFGQVQLSSVGINFILELTPVLSRKR